MDEFQDEWSVCNALRLSQALVVIPSRDEMRDNDDFSTILEAYKYKCQFEPRCASTVASNEHAAMLHSEV